MDISSNEILVVNNIHRAEEAISQKHEGGAAEKLCMDVKAIGLEVDVAVTDEGSPAKSVIKKHFPDCVIQVFI